MQPSATERFEATGAWLRAHIGAGRGAGIRLSSDSRAIRTGDVFFAYPGVRFDGRAYIPHAIAAGVAAVLWDDAPPFQWDTSWKVPNRPEKDLKSAAGNIAAVWHGYPAQQLRVVGITGTSGKSTCALWVAQALDLLGQRCAVAGTLGMGFVDGGSTAALRDTGRTTPDPIELQAELEALVKQGAAALAIEVSSIGLVEGRVNGMKFDIGVFTNLSRDHLDYHSSMQEYEAAKALLFDWPQLGAAVINCDDQSGRRLIQSTRSKSVRLICYSAQGAPGADLWVSDILFAAAGLSFTVHGSFGQRRVVTKLIGHHNIANFLAVLGVLLLGGHAVDVCLDALSRVAPVPGRMERVTVQDSSGPLVLVDYAHKPDALEKVLEACRPIAAARGGRLVVVFGCGGERDAGKRPVMGEIAQRLADELIVTSDNPRGEDGQTIIAAIVAGFRPETVTPYRIEPDRAKAVHAAIAAARDQDVVLIAGKGHETYQEFAHGKMPYSDVDVATRALTARLPGRLAPSSTSSGAVPC